MVFNIKSQRGIDAEAQRAAAVQHSRSGGVKNGVSLREGALKASVVESDLSDYPDLSASARSFFTHHPRDKYHYI